MEEQPPMCRVTANLLHKQSWTADRGGPPAWRYREVLTTPRRVNLPCYDTLLKVSDLD